MVLPLYAAQMNKKSSLTLEWLKTTKNVDVFTTKG